MGDVSSDYGVLTEAGTIRFERLLPAPLERVWAYLTDGEKRARWLCGGAFDLRPRRSRRVRVRPPQSRRRPAA